MVRMCLGGQAIKMRVVLPVDEPRQKISSSNLEKTKVYERYKQKIESAILYVLDASSSCGETAVGMLRECYENGEELFLNDSFDCPLRKLSSIRDFFFRPEVAGKIFSNPIDTDKIAEECLNRVAMQYLNKKTFENPDITESTINRLAIPETPEDSMECCMLYMQELMTSLVIRYFADSSTEVFVNKNEKVIEQTKDEIDDAIRYVESIKKEFQSLKKENALLKRKNALQENALKENASKENDISADLEKRLLKAERLYENSLEKIEKLKQQIRKEGDEVQEDEKFEVDREGKYLFVTNLCSESVASLGKRFPKSKITSSEHVSKETIKNSDMVVMNTDFLSHSDYYKIKEDARKSGTPVIYTTTHNVDIIEKVIGSYC